MKFVHLLKHGLAFIWEQLKHWLVAGGVLIVTGFLPEHWIQRIIEILEKQGVPVIRLPGFDLRAIFVFVGVAIVVGDVLFRLRHHRRLTQAGTYEIRAKLDVLQDEELPHVPIARIAVDNLGRRDLRVTRIEFVTKGHWDLPDPARTGSGQSIFNVLPRGAKFLKISPDTGSLSIAAVGATVKPNQSITRDFRLTTDHSPADGLGIFPYHLGVQLVYGDNDLHLSLPDLLVSLHGLQCIGETTYDGQSIWRAKNAGDNQQYANAALGRIGSNVICPAPVLHALRQVIEEREP